MQICQSKIHTYILKFIKKSFSLFTLEDCLVYQKNLVLYTKNLNFRINFPTTHIKYPLSACEITKLPLIQKLV